MTETTEDRTYLPSVEEVMVGASVVDVQVNDRDGCLDVCLSNGFKVRVLLPVVIVHPPLPN